MTAAPPTVKRLNWGCGAMGEPGWVNVDLKEGPRVDISGDIRDGLPLASDEFDYVVSIHALPEMPYPDIVPALAELRRVLKPGGTLRLALPDIEKGFEAYRRGDHDYFEVPDEDARSIGAKFVTQIVWYGYSRTFFTADFAAELLERAGFREISHVAFRMTRSPYPDIVELDNRERESLFVEAVK